MSLMGSDFTPLWTGWGLSSNVVVMDFIFFDQLVVLLSRMDVLSLGLASSHMGQPPLGFLVEVSDSFLFVVSNDTFEVFSFSDEGVLVVDSVWFGGVHQSVDPVTIMIRDDSAVMDGMVTLNPVPVVLDVTLGLVVSGLVSLNEFFEIGNDFLVFVFGVGVVDIVEPDVTLVLELP